jgi:hypothetical protein
MSTRIKFGVSLLTDFPEGEYPDVTKLNDDLEAADEQLKERGYEAYAWGCGSYDYMKEIDSTEIEAERDWAFKNIKTPHDAGELPVSN